MAKKLSTGEKQFSDWQASEMAERQDAPKKTTKKKATKKPSSKKTTKKETASKKTTPAKTGAKKKDGLRKPQVRILDALKRNKNSLSRADIAEKAKTDLAMLNSYIGAHDETRRKANDAKNFPCLLTLGYVKAEQHEGEPITYAITAAGRKALDKAKAE